LIIFNEKIVGEGNFSHLYVSHGTKKYKNKIIINYPVL